MKKILVLGNAPSINSIQFDQLSPEYLTLGVNRIFLKHIPDYYFFHDLLILRELTSKPDIFKQILDKSQVFVSDYIYQQLSKTTAILPNKIKVYPRINNNLFPDSVTTAIQIFHHHFLKGELKEYYIAGVSLNWQTPSHFWKGSYSSANNHGADWYNPRFDRMFVNFTKLKKRGYNLISVTPKSNLNKILRNFPVENLYSR